MVRIEEIEKLLSQQSSKVDLRPILPPSRQLGQVVAGFTNSGGGYIILGAKRILNGFEVQGISLDFNITAITHKALDMLTPKPGIEYGFHILRGQQVFILSVPASVTPVLLQGKKFIRDGFNTVDLHDQRFTFSDGGEPKIKALSDRLKLGTTSQSLAKSKVVAHYQGSLKIIDNLSSVLYPAGINICANSYEGKILTRIIFSSIVDNFEIYLADLLYEIWLSNPNILKSSATVTLEQVLSCSDIEDFIKFYAKDKISRMKKGSVKAFLKDNHHISDLKIFSKQRITDVENILQIRHLYAHSNGIIDEPFLKYYNGTLNIGDEYLLTVEDIMNKMGYLVELIDLTDKAAVVKYLLSSS